MSSNTDLRVEQRGAVRILTINAAPFNLMSFAFMEKRKPMFNK